MRKSHLHERHRSAQMKYQEVQKLMENRRKKEDDFLNKGRKDYYVRINQTTMVAKGVTDLTRKLEQ